VKFLRTISKSWFIYVQRNGHCSAITCGDNLLISSQFRLLKPVSVPFRKLVGRIGVLQANFGKVLTVSKFQMFFKPTFIWRKTNRTF